MNAERYNKAEINRLIESATPNPHEACEATLEFAVERANYFMRESDNFQRQAERYQRRSRVLAAVTVALLGIVVALTVSR